MENQKINLVLFSGREDEHEQKIKALITRFFPAIQIERHSDTRGLETALRAALFGFCVVVILIRDETELDEILNIREKLKDHMIIMVLDDTIDDLTARTLKLYPRYTSYIKNDYEDIVLVLEKMITKIKNND